MLYTAYTHVTLSKIHRKYLCRKTDCTKKQEEYLCRNIKTFNISIYPLYTVFFWSVVKSTKVIPQHRTTPLTQRRIKYTFMSHSATHDNRDKDFCQSLQGPSTALESVSYSEERWIFKLFCGVWGTFQPSELIKTFTTGAGAGLTLEPFEETGDGNKCLFVKGKITLVVFFFWQKKEIKTFW